MINYNKIVTKMTLTSKISKHLITKNTLLMKTMNIKINQKSVKKTNLVMKNIYIRAQTIMKIRSQKMIK
jgi:hypothetical protein